jgi:four helix bundle protein
MNAVRSFRDLEVWQAAMDLAVLAHEVARLLPFEHRFELASQIRRASVSIPSNVAEGHAQKGSKIFLRHIRIAIGSLAELDTQIELAFRLKLLDRSTSPTLLTQKTRTWQLLHGTRRALNAQIVNQKRKRSTNSE